jgi:precorrin-6x reductase
MRKKKLPCVHAEELRGEGSKKLFDRFQWGYVPFPTRISRTLVDTTKRIGIDNVVVNRPLEMVRLNFRTYTEDNRRRGNAVQVVKVSHAVVVVVFLMDGAQTVAHQTLRS